MSPRNVKRVHDLAVDIELELTIRGVADTHRTAPFITLQTRQFEFREAPFLRDPVHYLQLLREPGLSRARSCRLRTGLSR
jgi:hypothetical protein